MDYRPGTVTRAAVVALAFVGAALANQGEVVWGIALVAALAFVAPLAPFARSAAAAFGLLVLARLASGVESRGVVAIGLSLAAIVALAYGLALTRRRRGSGAPVREAVAVCFVLAAVGVGAAALLATGKPALGLAFVPLAGLIFLWPPAAVPTPRLPTAALALGLALAGLRLGAGFGFALAAEKAFARGDFGGAECRARWAERLGAEEPGRLVALEAAASNGAPWPALRDLAAGRPSYAPPRPYDAVLAAGAFERGDYERAAMYGDLAAATTPVAPVSGGPVPRADLYRVLEKRAATPYGRAWLELWGGDATTAAGLFAALGPAAAAERGLALERGARAGAAGAYYAQRWQAAPGDIAASFGLLRAGRLERRGEIWNALARRYPTAVVGTKLRAVDGYPLSKYRLSLGRKPATFRFLGGGRRRVAVIAESFEAGGLYPIVSLTVNGRTAHTFYMNVAGENIYQADVDLGRPPVVVGLQFQNDYADPARGLDRNVFIREVRLSDEIRPPTR